MSAAGLYQDVCSTISTNPGITTQYVEMTDGAIQESVSDVSQDTKLLTVI